MVEAEVKVMCVRSDVCRMRFVCPCDQTTSGWDVMFPKTVTISKDEVLRIAFNWE
jgi:hypothetical protein